ncbi:MAG: cell division protein SepF [Lachnospiraceae bacterium]|nr:cell division protein SepF [Lachnospiraceae bacterium]
MFDKMKNLMFGEYEDEDDVYEDEYEYPVVKGDRDAVDYPSKSLASGKKNNSQVVSIHTNVQMQVVIIKPECYEDAQEICDQIKSKKPVVVNLEKVEYPIAQRIMDFLSGTCYSLDGSIQRVANNIFIIAPENVDISGDFKEELKTKGVILPWVNSGK